MTRPGWVRLPASAFARWQHDALAALEAAREARWKNVSWEVPSAHSPQATERPPSSADALAERAKVAMVVSMLKLAEG